MVLNICIGIIAFGLGMAFSEHLHERRRKSFLREIDLTLDSQGIRRHEFNQSLTTLAYLEGAVEGLIKRVDAVEKRKQGELA